MSGAIRPEQPEPISIQEESSSRPDDLAPFVVKLEQMLQDESAKPYVDWNDAGDGLFVPDAHMFSQHVLPRFFKSSNVSSFVRQLNVYDFHKVSHENCAVLEFQHPNFLKGREDLLPGVKRKMATAAPCDTPTRKRPRMDGADADSVAPKLAELTQGYSAVESRLSHVESSTANLQRSLHIAEHRQRQTQERMHKVLYVLYQMYSADPSALDSGSVFNNTGLVPQIENDSSAGSEGCQE